MLRIKKDHQNINYQEHLDQVSRSFAFCIKRLSQPLRHQISLAYLLCRIVDTVEDSAWSDPQDKKQSFEQVLQWIKGEGTRKEISYWASNFPASLSPAEKKLIKSSPDLIEDLYALPNETCAALASRIQDMTRGMAYFSAMNGHLNKIKIDSQAELNTYCFFVAGLVGEMLSHLIELQTETPLPRSQYLRSVHFGLFLQKINILKDRHSDLAEHRDFVPNWSETVLSLRGHADEAFDYIMKLSDDFFDFKVFCLWSLILGMASYPYIERSQQSKKSHKIPRFETLELIRRIEGAASSTENISAVYQKYADKLPKDCRSKPLLEPLPKNTYTGRLTTEDLMRASAPKC